MLWRPRFELTLETLPRSTLPSADGLFGRRSALAPAFGLPEGRLTPPSACCGCPCRPPAFGLLRLGAGIRAGRIACLPFWSPRALLRISRLAARSARLPGRSLLTSAALVRMELRAVRLDAVLDFRAVEIGQLVSVEVDLRPVDILPVDILPVDLAVDVVEAVVAVDVEVAAVPVSAPDVPVVPVHGGAPKGARHRACEEPGGRVVIAGIRLRIVGDRLRRVVGA